MDPTREMLRLFASQGDKSFVNSSCLRNLNAFRSTYLFPIWLLGNSFSIPKLYHFYDNIMSCPMSRLSESVLTTSKISTKIGKDWSYWGTLLGCWIYMEFGQILGLFSKGKKTPNNSNIVYAFLIFSVLQEQIMFMFFNLTQKFRKFELCWRFTTLNVFWRGGGSKKTSSKIAFLGYINILYVLCSFFSNLYPIMVPSGPTYPTFTQRGTKSRVDRILMFQCKNLSVRFGAEVNAFKMMANKSYRKFKLSNTKNNFIVISPW